MRPWLCAVSTALLLTSVPYIAFSSDDADPAADQVDPDTSDYETLQEVLEGLGVPEQLEALEEFLERHPSSRYRPEVEQQLATLRAQATQHPRDGSARAAIDEVHRPEPLSFEAADPAQRLNGQIALGAPAWLQALLGYDHHLSERVSIGGIVGLTEGNRRIEGVGRYVAFRSPRAEQTLSGALAVGLELGDDSTVQLNPRVGYGAQLGPFDLQASIGARIRVPRFAVRYQLGVGAGVPVGQRLWLALETAGYVQRVEAVRTDLPTTLPTWVSFFTLTAGARYQISSHLSAMATASIPDWYRYRKDFGGAVAVGFQYVFDPRR